MKTINTKDAYKLYLKEKSNLPFSSETEYSFLEELAGRGFVVFDFSALEEVLGELIDGNK